MILHAANGEWLRKIVNDNYGIIKIYDQETYNVAEFIKKRGKMNMCTRFCSWVSIFVVDHEKLLIYNACAT